MRKRPWEVNEMSYLKRYTCMYNNINLFSMFKMQHISMQHILLLKQSAMLQCQGHGIDFQGMRELHIMNAA